MIFNNILKLFSVLLLVAACSSGGGNGDGNGAFGGSNGGNGNGGGGDSTGVKASGMLDLNGTWKGEGGFTIKGESGVCENVEFAFTQTTSSLKLNKGEFKCGTDEYAFEATSLKVQQNLLYENDQQVGTISATEIIVQVSENGATETIAISKMKDGSITLVYSLTQNGQTDQLYGFLKK